MEVSFCSMFSSDNKLHRKVSPICLSLSPPPPVGGLNGGRNKEGLIVVGRLACLLLVDWEIEEVRPG